MSVKVRELGPGTYRTLTYREYGSPARPGGRHPFSRTATAAVRGARAEIIPTAALSPSGRFGAFFLNI